MKVKEIFNENFHINEIAPVQVPAQPAVQPPAPGAVKPIVPTQQSPLQQLQAMNPQQLQVLINSIVDPKMLVALEGVLKNISNLVAAKIKLTKAPTPPVNPQQPAPAK
jgi:hypothetical protein